MVPTRSLNLPLGRHAPDFRLPDTRGKMVALSDYKDAKAALVMFICNHCPFVRHVRQELARLGKEYQDRGVAVFGISSNDVETHPEDSPQKMKKEARSVGYTFPYLYDESQETAKAYNAACTPDFYVFDDQRRLVYHGQFDDSRPGTEVPVTGKDLREALDAVLENKALPVVQKQSIGCNIKSKAGIEPDYGKAA